MRLAAEIGELQPTDPNQMPSRGRLPIRRRNPCLGRCSLLAILAKISTPPKKRGSRVASFSIAYALENAVTSLCRGKRRINQRFPSRFSIDNLFGKRVPNYTHANRRRTPVRMARKRRPDRRESVGAKPSHTLCAAANSRFHDPLASPRDHPRDVFDIVAAGMHQRAHRHLPGRVKMKLMVW